MIKRLGKDCWVKGVLELRYPDLWHSLEVELDGNGEVTLKQQRHTQLKSLGLRRGDYVCLHVNGIFLRMNEYTWVSFLGKRQLE